MRLSLLAAAILSDVLLGAPGLVSANPQGLWLEPSQKWLGIDGGWSTFGLFVGSPAQQVYLTVSTALSEIWVVGKGGCYANALCTSARGGVLDYKASKSWTDLGAWNLGLSSTGMSGNGDYGLETLAMFNSVGGSKTTAIDGALVAAINTTDYYLGFIGLGVVQGRFANKIANPLISQLAETYGTIGSHSYGYTAGAQHMSGTPASLILGGYDPLRMVNHDTVFSLDPRTRVPQVRLRAITVSTTEKGATPPANWGGSRSKALVSFNDSVTALIDSSLPYLTLPQEICDRFASALNLTYNETLGTYTFQSADEFTNYLKNRPYTFTFTMSSWDNNDNFGSPLTVKGTVNITVTAAAFGQLLSYPFKGAFQPTDSSVPYFPLRRAANTNEISIGRVFLQEAYIITKYDEEIFSIHQALFPDNASKNYTIQPIARSPSSQYPAYKSNEESGVGLTTGQTAGIVVAAFLVTAICGLALWCCRRRRKRRRIAAKNIAAVGDHVLDDDHLHLKAKDAESALDSEGTATPTSPMARFFSSFVRRKRSRRPASTHEMNDTTPGGGSGPAEVGADSSHERYELEVPLEPVELDGTNEITASDHTDLATMGPHGLSPYEVARIKLARELQGPLPSYSPPTGDAESSGAAAAAAVAGREEGKSEQDVSPVAHYRPGSGPRPRPTEALAPPGPRSGERRQEDASPVSVSAPSSEGANTNSLPLDALPSPMSPHPDWGTRMFDLPSPMTLSASSPRFPTHSMTGAAASNTVVSSSSTTSSQMPLTTTRSISSRNDDDPPSPLSSGSPHSLVVPPSPTFQRTPIDSTKTKIVCLGPLPENVRLPIPGARQPPATSSTSPAGAGAAAQVKLPRPDSASLQPPSLISPRFRTTAAATIGGPAHAPSPGRPPPPLPLPIPPPPPPPRDGGRGSGLQISSSLHHARPKSPDLNPPPPPSPRGGGGGVGVDGLIRRGSADTLGSNYTVEEEARARRREQQQDNDNDGRGGETDDDDDGVSPTTPQSSTSAERIEAGIELVHVPQLASRRYSWEDDRR